MAIETGKVYRVVEGYKKGAIGKCIETSRTSFGFEFLKLQTKTGPVSVRFGDVELVKPKTTKKKGKAKKK